MAATFDDTARMKRTLARLTLRLQRRFHEIILQTRRSRPTGEIARLIAAGRIEELFAIANQAAALYASEVSAAFILAGGDTATFLSGATGVLLDFDQTNEVAVQALRSSRFRLIREFTEQQRGAVREALTEGTRRGLNPREQARAFRGSIGLTQRQEAAVGNYNRMLREMDPGTLSRRLRDRRFDPTVRRSLQTGEPLTNQQVETMTRRYRERYLKYRAETIGRTEALRAVHESSEIMYGQAIEAGALSPGDLEREWNTAADERVRGSHQTMHGQVRALGDPFVSGDGYLLRYPGDADAPPSETVQCRCTIGTRVTAPVEALAMV